MSNQLERLLQLWKTAGQQTRLEEMLPFLVREISNWGTLNRLLLCRWNGALGFLESLLHHVSQASKSPPSKLNCNASLMQAFLNRIGESHGDAPVVYFNDTTEIPAQLGELFSGTLQGTLCLALIKDQSAGVFFLLLDLEIKSDIEPLTVYLSELSVVIATLLEREMFFRKLSQLRESAEAEKETLLNQLGRRDLASENIVGADKGLRRVLERVELIAATNTPVLILGETGSGKAMIARAIHNRSSRASRPFMRFNCGAVLPELIDAQLFGKDKSGKLERIDGGTLFLDDIHELPLSTQTRLLRLIEHGIAESSDGKKEVTLDVRVIAATDRDLGLSVSESQFCEELWYKLASFPIRLPTLRERLDDLPELAKHFAGRTATRFGLPLVLPTEQDIEFLKAYSWPGNVRELGTVIDRAALLGNGKTLDVVTALGVPDRSIPATQWGSSSPAGNTQGSRQNHWPNNWQGSRPNSWQNDRQKKEHRREAFLTIEPLDDVLRRYFEFVLSVTDGKIEGTNGAAELLQLNPNTLRAKLKKLCIDWNAYKSTSKNSADGS